MPIDIYDDAEYREEQEQEAQWLVEELREWPDTLGDMPDAEDEPYFEVVEGKPDVRYLQVSLPTSPHLAGCTLKIELVRASEDWHPVRVEPGLPSGIFVESVDWPTGTAWSAPALDRVRRWMDDAFEA